ncbi:LysM domain-containing protein [Planctomonas sp. JC2975]|uniref:LysM domain-containing protein n=1 Tax=Planctomonas sp. JC2975 TaxID=2729626 RepID=UPI001472BF30|nr:LysM domain-containing protein [Planctomonas sp. JC2975]NNC13987.1 LysM domain-containing protein [Planctomonas sp. JC2975]
MVGGRSRGNGPSAKRSARWRRVATVGVAVSILAALAGCVPASNASAHGTPTHKPHATKTARPTASAPNPALSHPATVEPASTPEPAPTLLPVPAGTVVAEGDVASPKGSIHYHYRVVANGDNTYTAQYSGFTSTVPIPVSVTLIDIAPNVGDGLTWHGVGDHVLGGPVTTATSSTGSLGSEDQPSYLTSIVTYSSAASADGVPVELGPNKVLAVNTVKWSVPVRQSNVHPADGGSRTFATGKVTATTSGGAPKSYVVAPGDITDVVAARFGISVADLIWLNANLQVFGDQQYLYEGTTLNLDPDGI